MPYGLLPLASCVVSAGYNQTFSATLVRLAFPLVVFGIFRPHLTRNRPPHFARSSSYRLSE